ncbi:MAG: tetratricopeptide repeat protein [Calditrichaeota bacterium]|nr:MAG: tetratricopeptide repeat protein [bacterium]RQV98072.1 MAG: tetratricopeptide repeat protein [Calditrichota bacterium]
MKRFYLISLIIFLQISRVYGAGHPNPQEEPVKNLILQGIELTLNNRFEQAFRLYQDLIERYPHHPVGYFYCGATLQAQMLDREDYSDAGPFYSLMEKSIVLSDSLDAAGVNDPWVYFYSGSSHLYRGFLKMKLGEWFSAYKDASNGVSLLEKAIEQDSSLYDAWLGIGSYRYWKSARADFLLWLPFIPDERDEGIRMVYQAIEKGYFVEYVGKDQLVWMLLDYGRENEALALARENHLAFPGSRFFKWTLAAAAFRSREFDLSFRLYQELLDEIRNLPDSNHFNEIDCLVHLAEIEQIREDWLQAFRWSDEALRLNLDPEIRQRAKNKLKKALTIRNEAKLYIK